MTSLQIRKYEIKKKNEIKKNNRAGYFHRQVNINKDLDSHKFRSNQSINVSLYLLYCRLQNVKTSLVI